MRLTDLWRRPSAQLGAGLAMVLVLGVAAYGWTLPLALIGPDAIALIAEGSGLSHPDLLSVVTAPVTGGRNPSLQFHRPVSQAFFVIQAQLFGLHPLGYHVASLAVHLLCGVLTLALARLWTGSTAIAVLAGGILVVHPLGVATVPFPSHVQDMLATLLGLGALLIHESVLRRGTPGRWVLVSMLCALAMLAKESGLLFSGLVLLSHTLRGRGSIAGRSAFALAWLLLLLLPALVLRFVLLGDTGGYLAGVFQISPPSTGFHLPYFEGQTTMIGFLATFVGGLLDPARHLSAPVIVAAVPVLLVLQNRRFRTPACILFAWVGGMLGAHLYLTLLRQPGVSLHPWHLYAGLPAVAILLAAAIGRGLGSPGVWARVMAAGAAFVWAVQLVSSPLVRSYPSVEIGSASQRRYFEALDHFLRARTPETTTVNPGSMPLLVFSHHAFADGTQTFVAPWTVEAWLELAHPDVPARVVSLSSLPAASRGVISVQSEVGWLEVDHGGRVSERFDLAWKLNRPPTLTQLRLLESAVENRPKDPQAWLVLGDLCRRLSSTERGETALRTAVRLQPDLWQAHYALAELFGELGRLREAESELQEVLQLLPGFGPAEHGLALVRDNLQKGRDHFELTWESGRPETPKQIRLLEAAVENRPKDPQAWLALGDAHRRLSSWERAETALRRAVRLEPGLWQAHYALAQLFSNVGRLREAESELLEVLRLNPGFAPAERGLASVRDHPGSTPP